MKLAPPAHTHTPAATPVAPEKNPYMPLWPRGNPLFRSNARLANAHQCAIIAILTGFAIKNGPAYRSRAPMGIVLCKSRPQYSFMRPSAGVSARGN